MRFCNFFAVSLYRWVLRLPVGKATFACYSSSAVASWQSEFCGCQLAKRLLLAIQVHQDLV